MKICLINNLYKPFNRGGAEKVTETIANGLIKAGHEIFIITTKPYSGKSQTPNPNIQIYYLNSLFYHLNKLPKFIRFFWHIWDMYNFINYFKIKRILKKEKCGAVIASNLMGLGFLTPLAISRLKIKQIQIVHDIQLIHPSGLLLFGQEKIIDSYFSRNYAGLCSRIFASPKIVIFPSRWLMNMYLDKIFFIKSKRLVIPNPVAPRSARLAGALAGRANQPQKNNDIFKFLYLGQIEKHKGLNLLIQGFKKVKEKFPRTELIIAGAGSELEQAKIEAGQDNSIKFLGRQDEAEINRLLTTCQSLIVPTLCYENCPTVMIEAFSAGLPVIAADLGGISELIGETAGVLFRPGKVIDLVEKMEWAVNNQNDLAELAAAGRVKAASYDVKNYIRELERLIRQQ